MSWRAGKKACEGEWEETVRSQASFHPGLRPKGKQVYLDSRQGGVGWPCGAGLGLSGVGLWRGAALTMRWESGPRSR